MHGIRRHDFRFKRLFLPLRTFGSLSLSDAINGAEMGLIRAIGCFDVCAGWNVVILSRGFDVCCSLNCVVIL